MHRRDSLARIATAVLGSDELERLQGGGLRNSRQARSRKIPPVVTRTTAGLEPYAGEWTATEMYHLLRRTTFGPSKAHMDAIKLTASPGDAVDLLLTPQPAEPTQPLVTTANDLVPSGTTWVNSIYSTTTVNPTGYRIISSKRGGWGSY